MCVCSYVRSCAHLDRNQFSRSSCVLLSGDRVPFRTAETLDSTRHRYEIVLSRTNSLLRVQVRTSHYDSLHEQEAQRRSRHGQYRLFCSFAQSMNELDRARLAIVHITSPWTHAIVSALSSSFFVPSCRIVSHRIAASSNQGSVALSLRLPQAYSSEPDSNASSASF